jgi:hypothetical protein
MTRNARFSRCWWQPYQRLALDLEKLIATNAIVDDGRDKRLLSLLGNDGVEHLDEVANLSLAAVLNKGSSKPS